MVSTSDFKKGLKLLIDNQPFTIIDFQHHKPGKGNSITRTKLKNLITGVGLEKTIKSGEKFKVPDVDYQDMSFLYFDESGYHFMNQSDFEQISLSTELIGNDKFYLTENMEIKICLFNERAVSIDLPNTVNLIVSQTDPGLKGNTVTGTTKPATLQTGLVVHVPLHISQNDLVKVDTRTGDYLERVNKK